MSCSKRVLALIVSAALVLSVAGCGGGEKQSSLKPTVAPPVISKAGVLRAGVDLSYPPFAGEEKGQKVGIDVDVAAALAERLGLTLELVDVKPADASAALQNKQIDVALGAVPITDAVLAGLAPAGSYLVDGAGFFAVVASGTPTPEVSAGSLGGRKVGCQKESAVYWKLESDYGDGFAMSFDSLREAFDALKAGEVDVVACDAAVGAYIARDYPDATFVGQYGDAAALGVSVAPDSTELETAVRQALDALSADGVLETIRTKWLGGLPALHVPASTEATGTP